MAYKRWRVTLHFDEFFRNPKRAHKRVLKKALMKAGEYWHQTYIKQHFSRAAYHRYADEDPEVYRRRHDMSWYDSDSGQWVTRSAEPLNESGWTRTRAMSSVTEEGGDKWAGISGTSTSVKVRFTVPSYINALEKQGEYHPHEEMQVLNAREINKLVKVVDREAEKRLGLATGQLSSSLNLL